MVATDAEFEGAAQALDRLAIPRERSPKRSIEKTDERHGKASKDAANCSDA